MRRREVLGQALAFALFAGGARADALSDRIVAQLRRQGYDSVTVSRTLLGRMRILASGAGQRREIILNPRTGEILRDFWQDEDDDTADRDDGGILDPDGDGGRGRGRGRGGDEPDEVADTDDVDADDGDGDGDEDDGDDDEDDDSDDDSDDD